MPWMNFSGPLLNAFVTLAQSRRFTVAARRCHLSQSAFSQAIARLESHVGTRLFERSTRSVVLTPEGERLLPVAQRVLDEMQAAIGELRDHAERRTGKVAIAALPSLAADWLPGVFARFRERYPGIALQLHDVVLERTLALVREGTVDFAINANAGYEEEFETTPLFEDRFHLVCRPDHALARRRSVRLTALTGQPYIHSLRNASMWRQLYPRLREVALRDTGIEVNYLATLAGMIANGLGVSIVTGMALFNFTRRGLVCVPITEPGLRYRVDLVRRRGHAPSIAARAFEETLMQSLPQASATGRKR